MKTFVWFLMFLVAGSPLAWSAPASASDAVLIYANDFGEASDVNYDTWPDRWEKISGPHYQHYVHVGIVDDPTAKNGRSLQVDLNGGGAAIATPPIHVLQKFGYRLKLKIKTEALEQISVRVRVDLQNRDGEVLQQVDGRSVRETDGWLDVDFPTFRPTDPDIDRAVIWIDAPRTGRGDLLGKIWVDQIQLFRLPSMIITTGRMCNFYDDFSEIKVTCTLSGIREQNPEIRFQLLDATSTEIPGRSEDMRIPLKLIVEDSRMASDIVGGIGDSPNGYEGSTVWEPRIDDFGFYKIRVKMLSQKGGGQTDEDEFSRELDDQEITLVVLPPLPKPSGGEFGWTLPLADRPLSFDVLEELLPRLGVQWVKLPVWYPADDPSRGDTLVKFAERVANSGIEVVGIIDDPTITEYATRKASDGTQVANLLQSDPSVWQPIYDHVMTRLSLRFRWWQLGNDYDTSFYSYPDLSDKIASIRKLLFRFGQEVNVGIGWRWHVDTDREVWLPPESNPAWDFEQMSSSPLLNADQLQQQMRTVPTTSAARWVLVDPQPVPLAGDGQTPLGPKSPGYHELRVRELVRQMIAGKKHGADGIFIANPFTGPDGVLNVDGTPGELLLPWRTTSMLLAGKTYLGSLQLPQGSTNHVFMGDDDRVVMVVWNDTATTETLYLGDKISQIDVWGKQRVAEENERGESAIEVGRMPTFVVGLQPDVARWRLAVALDVDRLPSVFALEQDNAVRGRNFFPQGVAGTFSIYIPALEGEESRFGSQQNDTWEITPRAGQFSIAPGQSFDLPFRILLKEATYGMQPVRIDFDFEADRRYRFSVWRNIEVGLGDVEMAVRTWLDDSGNLVVEQKMVNKTETPLDFKCWLDAPPRRKKRAHVVMLDAEGSTKLYQYPDGESLLGNVLKLKAEEINGSRVLIFRFVAEP